MLLRQSNGKIDCLENASNSPIQIVHNESKKHMYRANVFFFKKTERKDNFIGRWKAFNSPPLIQ